MVVQHFFQHIEQGNKSQKIKGKGRHECTDGARSSTVGGEPILWPKTAFFVQMTTTPQ